METYGETDRYIWETDAYNKEKHMNTQGRQIDIYGNRRKHRGVEGTWMPRRQLIEQEDQIFSVVVGMAPLLNASWHSGMGYLPSLSLPTLLASGRVGAGFNPRKTEKRFENNTFNCEYLNEFLKKFETALLI
jgi:hypothetical protein